MPAILSTITASILLIVALLGAPADGPSRTSSTLAMLIVTFVCLHALLLVQRIGWADR